MGTVRGRAWLSLSRRVPGRRDASNEASCREAGRPSRTFGVWCPSERAACAQVSATRDRLKRPRAASVSVRQPQRHCGNGLGHLLAQRPELRQPLHGAYSRGLHSGAPPPANHAVVAGLLLGLVASTGYQQAIVASLALPHLAARNKLAALGYYVGALWPISTAAASFFQAASDAPNPTLLWLAAALLHVAPFAILPAKVATLISSFGYASPMMAAGLLFPGLGWLGVALTALSSTRLWPLLLAVAGGSNLVYQSPKPPEDWIAINTNFGLMQSPIDEYRSAAHIQGIACRSRHRVIIFPESVIPWWSEGVAIFWEDTIERVRREGKTFLVGTKLFGKPYSNVLLARGSDDAVFHQSIPVPIAMSGSRFDVFASNTGTIAGHRVTALICHEQLLLWSMLRTLAASPDVLIGISNDHWIASTPIPRWKSTALKSIAQIAGVPYLSATNY
jgi:hypothetical protein